MTDSITQYNATLSGPAREIAESLRTAIDRGLPEAESKCWHGHPVWFLDGNPVAGYSVRKSGVALLFWSGQSFEVPGLTASGSFKMAEIRFHDESNIDSELVSRWLENARNIQWDYKNIIKRKGELVRLT